MGRSAWTLRKSAALGVASGLEADAFNFCGIPRHELEDVVGDLNQFLLKIGVARSHQFQFARRITQRSTATPLRAAPAKALSSRRTQGRLIFH